MQDAPLKNNDFQDAAKLDKKIPPELLMQYQSKWYILKAGLEWKANLLFGGGNYGVTTEIIERTPEGCLVKATFKTKDGVEFSNYGEASKANVSNPQMHKYMLHLAVTRAECRVLRMATACGYTSVEEMDMDSSPAQKTIPVLPTDGDAPTAAQLSTLKTLGSKAEPKTQAEAKAAIVEATKAGK